MKKSIGRKLKSTKSKKRNKKALKDYLQMSTGANFTSSKNGVIIC